ncbi:MAG: T9SS type A sorting domain-containing protein, partial [Cytophagaceae bacterium]|nr:T9SS type A sorting domain-containing protein [Cytophagaceae bacterium]
ALLTWGTAIELNSSYFIIEKSLDGISFSSIGRVEAAGNSSSLIRYNFTDPSITSGITYYRLAEYDIDGSLQYSPIRAVHKEGVGQVEVIPNPNNGTFVVTVNTTSDIKSRLVVLNILGQVVYEEGESTSNYRTVNISSLPAGTYYLQLSTAEETIGKKIIKE